MKDMEYLETPFGRVKILIDDVEFPYYAIEKVHQPNLCPDVIGRFHITLHFEPDGREHEIKCIIPEMACTDRDTESGELFECQAFYKGYDWKLSIGLVSVNDYYVDVPDRNVCEFDYLDNGMSYIVLENTRGNEYTFGIAWIDSVNDIDRDIQTWFAADPTID